MENLNLKYIDALNATQIKMAFKKYKITVEIESNNLNETILNEEVTQLRKKFEEQKNFDTEILNVYWVQEEE